MMRCPVLFAAAALLVHCCPLHAQEEGVPQRVDRVFVGRLLEIERRPDPCTAEAERTGELRCITMDVLYQARYVVEQALLDTRVGEEISFQISDHYGFPAMARQPHALLFIGDDGTRRWLHKYQGFSVQRTRDGGWAACGPVFPVSSPGVPAARPLEFAGDFGDARSEAAAMLLRSVAAEDVSVEAGRLHCHRGLPLEDVYEGVRSGVMQTRDIVLLPWPALEQRDRGASR